MVDWKSKAEKLIDEQKQQQESEKKKLELDRRKKHEESIQILNSLGTRVMLAQIRDQIWGKGEIRESGGSIILIAEWDEEGEGYWVIDNSECGSGEKYKNGTVNHYSDILAVNAKNNVVREKDFIIIDVDIAVESNGKEIGKFSMPINPHDIETYRAKLDKILTIYCARIIRH